jgi:hypothetical protein
VTLVVDEANVDALASAMLCALTVEGVAAGTWVEADTTDFIVVELDEVMVEIALLETVVLGAGATVCITFATLCIDVGAFVLVLPADPDAAAVELAADVEPSPLITLMLLYDPVLSVH